MSAEQDAMNERLEFENTLNASSSANRAAMASASQQAQETLFNPHFFDELRDPDVDSELYDWLEDELGPVLSGAHIVGNRDEHYEHQQQWLNQNRAERQIAERTPGRLLRNNPYLLAVAQDVSSPSDPAFREPMTQPKRRVTRDAYDVATTLQSLSVGGYGLDSVTTATAESRVVKNDREKSGTASRLKKVFE